MIDIADFIKGLKVSWIHNLNIKTSAPWVQLAKHIDGDINKIVLFFCSGIPKGKTNEQSILGRYSFCLSLCITEHLPKEYYL